MISSLKLSAILAVILLILCSQRAEADTCNAIAGNLVTNCGFETGDFSGWSFSGLGSAPSDLGVSHGVDYLDAHSGLYGAYFGGFGGVLNLLQAIPTTPGSEYQLTFWLAQGPATVSPYVSSFTITFSGQMLFAAGNAPDLPYTRYSFLAIATSSTAFLTFGARDDTGFFSIDDVSVVPVATPEPRSVDLLGLAAGLLFLVGFVRAEREKRSGE